ncbi:MAG: hypothetical protein IJ702_00830 [Fretibacterium sp.]|nr:hypothetical protein [Fretibacterium sp.]
MNRKSGDLPYIRSEKQVSGTGERQFFAVSIMAPAMALFRKIKEQGFLLPSPKGALTAGA